VAQPVVECRGCGFCCRGVENGPRELSSGLGRLRGTHGETAAVARRCQVRLVECAWLAQPSGAAGPYGAGQGVRWGRRTRSLAAWVPAVGGRGEGRGDGLIKRG
jgi:hypothetical protein